uniref:Parkin coregulated gene protein homolog n=1 Tax=Ascaris lumbricoides TaxID=6252 RepID=A0A0M3I7B1_ASCLU
MIERECRKLTLSERMTKKPPNDIFADMDPSEMKKTKPFSYHGRDIIKDNKRQQIAFRPKQNPMREVPAFSIQTQQKNTRTAPPTSTTRLNDQKMDEWGKFRIIYDGGGLPVRIDHGGTGERFKSLYWLNDPGTLSLENLHDLLSKFCLGLPLLDQFIRVPHFQPYRFIAERGVTDLLNAMYNRSVLINCLPIMVPALRASLYSFDNEKRKTTLKLIIRITQMEPCGPALVPYYRQLLPPLRMVSYCGFKADIDYRYGPTIDELVETTLNILEKTGGPNAYINIKYIIPTYQSCTGAH